MLTSGLSSDCSSTSIPFGRGASQAPAMNSGPRLLAEIALWRRIPQSAGLNQRWAFLRERRSRPLPMPHPRYAVSRRSACDPIPALAGRMVRRVSRVRPDSTQPGADLPLVMGRPIAKELPQPTGRTGFRASSFRRRGEKSHSNQIAIAATPCLLLLAQRSAVPKAPPPIGNGNYATLDVAAWFVRRTDFTSARGASVCTRCTALGHPSTRWRAPRTPLTR